ncbi:flavin-containing monooxygenase [Mycolicibacter senuensis]|uniref:FAD-containing monooxygenase EthA n=1 Tax=Mycolicibacter senuensis TaxID=386913 RepID=A0A7I9XMY7_9MYCO|nr:NAD(P)/FAD-dependent oxidoreductase [Mycolicibacter senuensis]MDQ2628274.1 NAD(P)/FAD-dependent oxidoreductase [Actinomycetota bacterium]ORW71322.1 FAD-containing monooxygenase EthA [Mycolicibacter senuensis]GFG71304.1 FAD-containing monooxygenase EthA [Mycolicibacter senuensis]
MSEYLDVAVVGAGISGISAAWHLQRHCPAKSYAILERRADLGGTWDLFRYPGIRSDSDMFTFAFRFKPWTADTTIADGATIKNYLREAVAESGIAERIRYGHRLVAADWSEADAAWRLTIERDGETIEMRCGFLIACSGYYDYDDAYAPEFPGTESFSGPIIHPQHWPTELDYAGKKIAVIGSGATAVTLVPALVASGAGHVTMVQRSPGYIGLLRSVDPVARWANRLLPSRVAAGANRWGYIVGQVGVYQVSRRFPNFMRKTLMAMARRRLPAGFDVAKHFGPSYQPWDQRLCLAPDGDFFAAISAGRANVVTDEIETFTPSGIRLGSGEELPAELIVTATGLNLRLFGGAEISRDGKLISPRDTVAYRGMMLSGVPNLAFTVGYSNASWTLKADLVSASVCRVLNYMDSQGFDTVVPGEPDPHVQDRPLVAQISGYVLRALSQLPRAGSHRPWRLHDNYLLDSALLRHAKVDDGHLLFTRCSSTISE